MQSILEHWSQSTVLAGCLQDMGLLKDAEPLYRRALEAQERTLGAEHLHTLVSINNLAGCLQAMGLPKNAEPLYRRALEAQERTLGAEHPHTLVSVNNLAECLRAMGLPKDAESALQESFRSPVNALSLWSILTHWSQSTIWQNASEPWACRKMQSRSTGEF